MPSASDIYKSGDWISANNDGTLNGVDGSPKEIELTISGVAESEFDDGRKQLVLSFDEVDAKYGAGRMAVDELVENIDDDYEKWPGHRVRLGTQRIPSGNFKGKTRMISLAVLGKAEGGAAPAAAAPAATESEHLFGSAYAAAIDQRLQDMERTVDDLRSVLVAQGTPRDMIAGPPATWPKALVDPVKAALEKLPQIKAEVLADSGLTEDDIPF